MENGYRALGVMEMHLAKHRFFVAGHYTIADIALYAYTHWPSNAISTSRAFPAIRGWLDARRRRARPRRHGLAAGAAGGGGIERR